MDWTDSTRNYTTKSEVYKERPEVEDGEEACRI